LYGVGRSTRNDGIESHDEPAFLEGRFESNALESELVCGKFTNRDRTAAEKLQTVRYGSVDDGERKVHP